MAGGKGSARLRTYRAGVGRRLPLPILSFGNSQPRDSKATDVAFVYWVTRSSFLSGAGK